MLGGAVGLTQGAVYLLLSLIASTATQPVWYVVLTSAALQCLMGLSWSIIALGLSHRSAPLAIRERVSKEMARILALPELRERLAPLGAEPVSSGPAEFETMVREYIARARKLGDAIGMKVE